jgi:hypothetical protein
MLLGRRLGGRGRVFLRIVEGWMEGLYDEDVWTWSGHAGKELREAKRKTRDKGGGQVAAQETQDQDYLEEIISHYDGLVSHTYLPHTSSTDTPHQFSFFRRPEAEGHVHPATRLPPLSPTTLSPRSPTTAEARSKAYRKLVGEESDNSDAESQDTKWGDFARR